MVNCRRLMAALATSVLCAASACSTGSTAESPSSPAGRTAASSVTYTSKAFAVPFTVTVPASLGPRPASDTRTFLTWVKSDGDEVSFLLPTAVYRPEHPNRQKPPGSYEKYLAFLREQVEYHAKWRDEVETTVDGRPATLLTGTTDWPLDGILGCPAEAEDVVDCYGLQPDLALRVAVVDVAGKVLVAWSTVNLENVNREKERDTSADFARFEGMLRSLRFAPPS